MVHPILKLCAVLLALVVGRCAWAEEVAAPSHADRIAVSLRDSADNVVALPAAGVAATVLVFVTPECPMANRYAPTLRALAEAYAGRVAFYRVYADASVTREAIAAHEAAYQYHFPGVLDPKLDAAQACGATRTPEVAVLDAEGALRYRGAVDDRYSDFGKYKQAASREYLREALDAVLAKKTVATERTEALGCYIAQPKTDTPEPTRPTSRQPGDPR